MTKDARDEIMVIEGGKRYDIAKVLSAYLRLIDAMAAEFGKAQVCIPRSRDASASTRRFAWALEGKRRVSDFWMQARALADTSDERVCHPIGGVTAQAYLLGNAALASDWTFHITAPAAGGGETASLANEPFVRVFGKTDEEIDRLSAMPTEQDLLRVEALLKDDVPDLRLRFTRSRPIMQPSTGAREQYAELVFPHEVYGDGTGKIRVRCNAIRRGDSKANAAN